MIQVAPYALNHPSYFENKVHMTVLSWIPPKVTILHLQTKVYYEKKVLENFWSSLASLMFKCCRWGWEMHDIVSLPLKIFRTESWDEILLRGEGCNTLGVCLVFWHLHFLSISIICLYKIVETYFDVAISECLLILHNKACGCWWCFFHVYHLHLYLGWSLQKFHKVWIQKVKWNNKLHACWYDLIEWTEPWVTNLILQS